MLKDKEKPPVVIRADENAAHKHVVTVMDVLADMGFKSVSIATTPSKWSMSSSEHKKTSFGRIWKYALPYKLVMSIAIL